MDEKLLARAQALREEADQLENEAFDNRRLPDYWKVGQVVRMLKNEEWAWNKGNLMTITKLGDPGTPARKYQVFWTTSSNGFGSFWTTPDDVELVYDIGEKPNGR